MQRRRDTAVHCCTGCERHVSHQRCKVAPRTHTSRLRQYLRGARGTRAPPSMHKSRQCSAAAWCPAGAAAHVRTCRATGARDRAWFWSSLARARHDSAARGAACALRHAPTCFQKDRRSCTPADVAPVSICARTVARGAPHDCSRAVTRATCAEGAPRVATAAATEAPLQVPCPARLHRGTLRQAPRASSARRRSAPRACAHRRPSAKVLDGAPGSWCRYIARVEHVRLRQTALDV